jgi:inosose dehydratase
LIEMRIANAPVSYGVFELTAGDANLPDPDSLLAAIADAGYEGTELGPPGYFGDGSVLAERLVDHALELVASFLPLRFSRAEHWETDVAELDRLLARLEAVVPEGARPLILLSDAFCEPERLRAAGRIEETPSAWLDSARFTALVRNVTRAVARCRERGFPVSFHHHGGTYVETPREIDRLLERLDPDLLGLCLDTGHSAFGGGDALELLDRNADRVNHVHLKDVDGRVMERIRSEGLGMEEAWRSGVFCRLGTGSVDIPAIIERLRVTGYDGWLVVEQDRYVRPGQTLAGLVADQVANRAYLEALGI